MRKYDDEFEFDHEADERWVRTAGLLVVSLAMVVLLPVIWIAFCWVR